MSAAVTVLWVITASAVGGIAAVYFCERLTRSLWWSNAKVWPKFVYWTGLIISLCIIVPFTILFAAGVFP